MKTFKFFENKKERVFTDFMDALDDYHLLGTPSPTHHIEVPAQQLKVFNLNVLSTPDVFARIPSYNVVIEPNDYSANSIRHGTIDDLINGRFEIPWCFTSLTIRRGGETQETFTSYTVITYENVDEINSRGLLFDREDSIIISHYI
jgi:hypothetical protein